MDIGMIIGLIVGAVLIAALMAHDRKVNRQREERLQELNKTYVNAKSSGSQQQITDAARAFVDELQKSHQPGLPEAAEQIYRDILKLLRTNIEFKPFALEMGRLAYGLKRKNKKPTIYDEQAILNDINAHT